MYVPDNHDLYDMYEREQERLRKKEERWSLEDLPFYEEEDGFKEVCFYINEREEDIEILEDFLIANRFDYEKEEF